MGVVLTQTNRGRGRKLGSCSIEALHAIDQISLLIDLNTVAQGWEFPRDREVRETAPRNGELACFIWLWVNTY